MKKEIPDLAREKKQWLKTIKKLQAALSHGEPRVVTQGEPRVATHGQMRVDGTSTASSIPTCPWTLRTKPRIYQYKIRRNTPVTEHTATEPAQYGEGLRQTQIYMRSDKAEPGGSPRHPQIIDKRSARVEPVPARTATNPRRSPRIKTGAQAPHTARDKRAKGGPSTSNASAANETAPSIRQEKVSLIKTQLKIDEATPPPTRTNNTTAREHYDTVQEPLFTYHVPFQKSNP